MLTYDQVAELRPRCWGETTMEPFADYLGRVKHLVPSWPAEVIEQWIYRHYPDMVDDYGWLLTECRCEFRLRAVDTSTVFSSVSTHKIASAVDSLGYQIVASLTTGPTWLQQFMLDYRTWPVPIIVLENHAHLTGPQGEPYGSPYHLLEGHLRLAYFRALHRSGYPLQPTHDVWFATRT